MPRPRKTRPDYRYYVSGQAVVTLNGKNFYLGEHDSPESHARYARLIAEYIESGYRTPGGDVRLGETPVTVADVTGEYRQHIKVKFANSAKEMYRHKSLCQLLEDEYGSGAANHFGPRRLTSLRETLIATGNSRRYVNRLIQCVRGIFRYAVSRELIDAMVLVKLETLEPLRAGQTTAQETDRVEPVDIEVVRATAKHLPPTVKAMVIIQAATGMRPKELCELRPCDVEMQPDGVWMYRPEKHKTAHRGIKKAIPLIGDAKAALKPFLEREPESYCFSPKESIEWYRVQKREARKTKVQPSQADRTKSQPKTQPRDRYDTVTYRQAITRAAEKAKVKHWFPYQLRHLAATEVRKAFGVESAQALLGHSRADMTEHYARASEAKAIEAAKAGPQLGDV